MIARPTHALPPPGSPSLLIDGMPQHRHAPAARNSLLHSHPTRPNENGRRFLSNINEFQIHRIIPRDHEIS